MNVVFLECVNSYGYAFSAGVSKVRMMVNGLRSAGAKCYIHNGLTGSTSVKADEVKYVEDVEVTTYKSSSNGYAYYFWLPIKNFPKLYKYLKSHRNKNEKNIVILEVPLFHIFVLYTVICKLLGYRIASISHEWIPTLKHTSFRDKYYNDPLYARFYGYLVHAILPISEYIIEKCKKFNKPYFKVPALADFPSAPPRSIEEEKYFLYCAQAGYFRIAKFIVDSFSSYIKDNGHYKLRMVLAGTESLIDRVRQYVSSMQLEDAVIIETKLPYKTLINRYCGAAALLIPLDPDYEQDTARFPQKIAEYTSTASPIIATNIGEIKTYFNDQNCILAEFSEQSFADRFTWVESNPTEAREVGRKGYELGIEKFNCMTVCKDLYEFFKTL